MVARVEPGPGFRREPDRKSTRLNSSHVEISYAVFCLKKKSAASRASRCRCTVACPSAASNIFRSDYSVINLDQLEALFDGGTDVNPEVLHGQGLAQGH